VCVCVCMCVFVCLYACMCVCVGVLPMLEFTRTGAREHVKTGACVWMACNTQ
jgi:hypothetical protein